MTCEVAVANRLGIALAADSAATFTQSGTGTRTYATGANKIFQLTEFDPVGCMIFNNSTLAGMPWELLIKAFRAQQRGPLPTIQAYCEDFRDFIGGTRSAGLLPEGVRRLSEQTSLLMVMHAVLNRLVKTANQLQVDLGVETKEAVTQALGLANAFIADVPISAPLSNEDLISAREKDGEELINGLEKVLTIGEFSALKMHCSKEDLADLIFRSLFYKPFEFLASTYTGIVIAGFGDDQFLPSCVSIKVYGFVAGKLIHEDGEGFTMEHTGRDCFITPFATRAMVETFMLGASSDVYGFVQKHFVGAAKDACQIALRAHGVEIDEAKLTAAVESEEPKFMDGWIKDISAAHLFPLLRVLGGLSLEELGELADTLVMLESLKEKVTYRTQSVGGPVDVALITKADGLVWIKRKLYFDAALNHRYLARVERKHRGDS